MAQGYVVRGLKPFTYKFLVFDWKGELFMTGTEISSLFGTDGISLDGVLDQIINLLPVVIPVMVGFIAIRKGYSFLISALRSA